ncbi:hypothetical protein RND81_05G160600 [Saponaria officinalis]|uniref:Uncharacterized protein n=1 Tax=Saponaria officinalis TaxID=3572 RepID=A0AAW1L1H6_SAPOF
MEKEEKNHGNEERATTSSATTTTTSKLVEPEFVLQWGKRIRCVRFKEPSKSLSGIRRKISSRIVSNTSTDSRVVEGCRSGKSPSPEKEERYYSTRGSGTGEGRENGDGNGGGEEKRKMVWPKLYISLSSKEKEEDFLAMKGCKLPQRPKKRAKLIQRTLLLVSPGAWLTDMCQERYEVREKKTPKKVQ